MFATMPAQPISPIDDAIAGAIDAARGVQRLLRRGRKWITDAAFAITQAVANSFKVEVLQGLHNFTASSGNTFNLALYTSSATLGAATTAYSSTNEVANSGSYSAGGGALTNVTPVLSSSTACCSFSTLTFTSATITAAGCLIYNATNSNRAVAVYSFGGNVTSTAGNFTITFPAQTAGNAVLQLA